MQYRRRFYIRTIINDIRNSGVKAWLLLIPVLVMAVIYGSIRIGENVVEGLLLREKFVSIHTMVDAIEWSVNVESPVAVEDLLGHSLASIARIDIEPFVYAAAFTVTDEGLLLLSERDDMTDFDPRHYTAFTDAIRDNTSGELTIGFTPEGMPYRDLLMYYKWMPTDLPYLIVIGVSKYSITTQVPVVMNMSLWLMVIVTFITMLFMWYIIIRQSMRVGKIRAAFTEFRAKGGMR